MSENTNQQETVYWDPNAQITITGVELATLIQVLDLQHVNLSSVPFSALSEIINGANQVKSVIIQRMNDQGLLSSAPITSENVVEVETE